MKTHFNILTIFLTFCFGYSNAQQVLFENINSNNALNIINQIPSASISEWQKNSEINTIQYGNQNFAEIYTNSKTELSIIQKGDYNYLNFDNSFEKDGTKSNIIAEGNNNIIDIVGSNSISEKIQIHIKGDNKTIFMRNY